jgi:hypothetical protein
VFLKNSVTRAGGGFVGKFLRDFKERTGPGFDPGLPELLPWGFASALPDPPPCFGQKFAANSGRPDYLTRWKRSPVLNPADGGAEAPARAGHARETHSLGASSAKRHSQFRGDRACGLLLYSADPC